MTKYGITDVKEVLHNPSYEVLFAEETKPELEGYEKGQLTELDTVNVMTGIYTGRSPKDKFFVMTRLARTQYGGLQTSTRTTTSHVLRLLGTISRQRLSSSCQARNFLS